MSTEQFEYMHDDSKLLLFAAGSPLIVDFEVAALSRGCEIAVIIRNMDLQSPALGQERIVDADRLALEDLDGAVVLVPLFTPGNRLRATVEFRGLRDRLGASASFGRLVHASATVARSAEIGDGSFINAGAAIGGAVKFRRHVIVNRSASVGHHVTADDFASFGPGSLRAGKTAMGRGSVIGAGAVVHPQVRIGANTVVAAGAVVRKSVPFRCIVAGHPARIVKRDIAGRRRGNSRMTNMISRVRA